MRLQIAEYAIAHSNAKASRKFEAPKSTISFMVKELLAARKHSEIVGALPANKGGRPLLLATAGLILELVCPGFKNKT
jgi:hypothetical protein